MRTYFYIIKMAIFWSVLIILGFSMINDAMAQNVAPDFLNSGQDAESSLGNIFKEIFQWLLYIAAGLGALSAALGLGEVTGFFGQKEKGIDKIKIGLAVVAISSVFLGIVAFFVGLGN